MSCPQYRSEMIQTIIGALGYVAKSLITYVKQLGFEENDTVYIFRKLQNLATVRTVKICKTFFLKFNDGT